MYRLHSDLTKIIFERELRCRHRHNRQSDTRTDAHCAAHLAATVETDPEATWSFVADQLNTHLSATRVEGVAECCAIQEDLGIKGETGILTACPSLTIAQSVAELVDLACGGARSQSFEVAYEVPGRQIIECCLRRGSGGDYAALVRAEASTYA